MSGARSDLTLLRRLLRATKPYRLRLVVLAFLDLLATPVILLTPVPLKIAVDSVIGTHPLPSALAAVVPDSLERSRNGLLLVTAILILTIALLGQAVELAAWVLRARTGEQLTLSFRARLFRQAQRLSIAFHDSRGSSNAIYRIQYDAPAIQHVTVDGLIPLVSALVSVVAMLVVIAGIDAKLCLVAVGVTPGLYILGRAYRRRSRRWYRDLADVEQEAFGVVQEVFTGLRVVKAFGREDTEHDRFLRRAGASVQAQTRLAVAEGLFALITAMVTAAGTAIVLYVGVRAVQAGSLTLGDLLLVMAYLGSLYGPLKTISRQVANIQGSLTLAERAFELLDEAPDVEERANAVALGRATGAFDLDDVSFAYEGDHLVLEHVDLHVPPGARVGISGRTGAGKSTLVSLITRFYDPVSGAVRLDGRDLRDYRVADLRNQFGIVLQDAVLFSRSIAENIAYARPEATFADIVEAATAAEAHEFITALPDGYDTLVGERGLRLSGGERQRIALARAFLKDAPILILDEPTSAVDHRTEAAIMTAMERLMQGRTTFLIAHRLSTLEGCDLRLEVEAGRVEVIGQTAVPSPRADATDGHGRQPMRILLVSQEYPPDTAHGGIATQTEAKARGLAARGHDVVVLSASVSGERTITTQDGVTVVRIPGGDKRLPNLTDAARWVTWSVEVAAAIAAIHAEHPVDVVDLPEFGGEGYVHLLTQTEWSRIPTVVQLHGPLAMLADTIDWPEVDSELYRTGTLMEATSVRLADAVMSSSAESRDWCARRYGLDPARVPVLHVGVDTERFHPVARPASDRPTIVFVGRVTESKGAGDLVDAAIRLAPEVDGLRVLLVGRSEHGLAERLAAQAADDGWPNLVEALGAVPHDDLPAVLGRAHVFAAPSHHEGGPGFVYLEAMACGLATVACEGSGVDEVIEHGVDGWLVPPSDVDALAAALRHLLDDEALRERLGRAARARVVEEYDAERCLDQLVQVYAAARG
jgi:ATP-binding cassette subfamily B protein